MQALFRISGRAVKAASAALLLCCLLILLIPDGWSGNEIVYFDLAHRWVEPDRFSEFHAMRDDSIARVVSFVALGAGIELFGMEGAFRAFGLVFFVLLSMAYLALVRSLRVDYAPAGFSLFFVLLLGQQSLVGGEFVFGSIEPKTFAYTFVLFGLASAFSGRRRLAALLFVIAVYCHFLVGAFWGLAALGFYLLEDGSARPLKLPFGLFVGLSLPLFAAILLERLGAGSSLTDASMPSLNTIYAEFRNPHHIAPFADISVFFSDWFCGIAVHVAVAILFILFANRGDTRDRNISIWIAGLNAYVVIATLIAFIDRETHALAAFYLFRPSALIWILSILVLMGRLLSPVLERRRIVSLMGLVAALVFTAGASVHSAMVIVRGPAPLASAMTPSQVSMTDWISRNTRPRDVILVEPLPKVEFMGEGGGVWAGIERLIDRPTLVNFKLVPTEKSDLARWYKLLMWRQAVFEGACDRIEEQSVAFLIMRTGRSLDRLGQCTELVWRSDETAILRVVPSAPR